MNTPTLTLARTVPHVPIGAREAGYWAALQAWQVGEHPKCTTSFLCQMPLGRLAIMTTLNGPGGHDWRLSLLEPGISVAEASKRHTEDFANWAQDFQLPHPRKLSAFELADREYKEAQHAGITAAWRRWQGTPSLASDLQRMTVAAEDVPTVAELAALAIAQAAPESEFSDQTQTLRDAFFDLDIPFSGRTPDLRAIDTLASILGLICDTMQEGPADLVSYMRHRRAVALRAVLHPLVYRIPKATLVKKQAAIDELFQNCHTLSRRKDFLGQDSIPYAGALPVRYPLVNMVADLLRQCQGSLTKWVNKEPVT